MVIENVATAITYIYIYIYKVPIYYIFSRRKKKERKDKSRWLDRSNHQTKWVWLMPELLLSYKDVEWNLIFLTNKKLVPWGMIVFLYVEI